MLREPLASAATRFDRTARIARRAKKRNQRDAPHGAIDAIFTVTTADAKFASPLRISKLLQTMAQLMNPPVPYVGPIHAVPGTLVQIVGIPHANCRWFAFNLQCGSNLNPRDAIALHISPKFEGSLSRVVRNSLQGNNWGLEENFGHFPFHAGQQFDLLVYCDSDHFKIAINNQHYTEFRYRLPLHTINTVSVDGEVQLLSLRIEGSAMTGQQTYAAPPAYSNPIPQYGAQPYGLQPHQQQNPYGTGGYPMSNPLPVPSSHSPNYGRVSPGIAGLGGGMIGAVGGAIASRLLYPGMSGGGYGHHHGKMKGFKLKHHKPKFHKPKFGKHHKHKFHSHMHRGSSSSSSSE